MNLLPGLRELRAPLAAGYMWIITVWISLSDFHALPQSRPAGDAWRAQLWDLGGALGKTTLLGITTFAAYLLGSFLEIDPNSLILQRVAPLLTSITRRKERSDGRLCKSFQKSARLYKTLMKSERFSKSFKKFGTLYIGRLHIGR